LQKRAKLRYHLAAWILRRTGLARVEVGLFLHHVDPTGLQTTLPGVEEGDWKARLAKEVDNSLAYWSSDSRSSGDPPSVHLGQVEGEIQEMMRPIRR
jgi:hypothetical protein